MELGQLEALVKVAGEGNFTRAAQELALSQPAVTRQIAALEKELGAPLLDRLGRRVQPTAAGAALLPYATQILQWVQEGREAVHEVASGARGTLRLGASTTAATYFLPPLLGQYAREHAAVEVSVWTGPSAYVLQLVRAGSVDMGVVMDYGGEDRLQAVDLGGYASVVVTPPGHGLLGAVRRGALPVEQLHGQPLLAMPRGTSLRRSLEEVLGTVGITPRISMELDSVEAIKQMVAAGLGVSLLPELAVATEVAAGRLATIPLAIGAQEGSGRPGIARPGTRHISAVYRSNKRLNRSQADFLRLLRKAHGPVGAGE